MRAHVTDEQLAHLIVGAFAALVVLVVIVAARPGGGRG